MSLRIDETVAYNLKLIRLKHNMTQQTLAERACLSKQTISNLEKGQGASSKTLERLAECLDVSPLIFYQEVSERDNIQLKRVSSSNNNLNDREYITEFTNITNRIINDTKYNIYYEQVLPTIKKYFKENLKYILNYFNIENTNKNHHIILTIEETLLGSIKQSIFGDQDEIDELIEE